MARLPVWLAPLVLAPALALAGPALTGLAPARAGESPAADKGFDVLAVDYTASLDPATGEASGEVALSARAMTAQAVALGLLLDAGLEVTSAVAEGYDVTITTQSIPPLRRATLRLSPTPPVGTEVTIVARYSGTLGCGVVDARGHRECSWGASVGHLRRGSVIPDVFDPTDTSATYELYRRSLTLTLPEGTAAAAAGDLVEETTAGGLVTRKWASEAVHTVQDMVVVYGALDHVPIPDSDPPMDLWFAKGDTKWRDAMVEWEQAIGPFLATLAGAPLPFARVAIVALPPIDGFDGTASADIVLLSESYGDRLGAGAFEETLAHETSHLWWGNVAYADEASAWLLEGLARMSELDYMALRYPFAEAGYEADDGIGRSNWHALLMRYVVDPDVPLLLTSLAQAPQDGAIGYSSWAYARGAATLDHLRVLVGRTAFAAALHRWASDCAFVRCTSLDFQTFLEDASGMDLDVEFAQHVRGAAFPEVAWSFTQAGDDVTVSWAQEPPTATSAVEMWLERDDGTHDAQPVTAAGANGSVTLHTSGAIARARPNPYHDPIIWSRAAVGGDVDFDGEVDGVDLVECTSSVIFGLTNIADTRTLFDVQPMNPRCDFDGSGIVDQADLEVIQAAFGRLRP
ncbi:MAG: M1 family aminopeptidase [Myxococcota bacterium]